MHISIFLLSSLKISCEGEDTHSLDKSIQNDLFDVLLEVAGKSELSVITLTCCQFVHDVGESLDHNHEILTFSRDTSITYSSQVGEELRLLKQRAHVVLGLYR